MFRILTVFHRWLALTTGLVIVFVAATGAATVFEGPIGAAMATRVAPGRELLSLDSLAAIASASVGGGTIGAVFIGSTPDLAYGFAIGGRSAAVNPYTGAVIPVPDAPSRIEVVARRVHQLHTSLLAGKVGSAIVAFVALASLVLVLTGLTLWWRDKQWQIAWSASWKRIIFDLHHTLGLIAALVLLVITGTGVWMGYESRITPLVLKLDRTPAPAGRPAAALPVAGAAPVSLDSVTRLARAAVPGAAIMFMQLQNTGLAVVALRYPEDHTPGGRSRVFIDRNRGTVLRAASTRTAGAGTRLLNLQRPLHTGDIFGVASQVVWFLASIVLATQAVTGSLMWWNGRAARKALRR